MTWAERRRIPVLLAAATLIPICVLSWLGLRILQQDRDVEREMVERWGTATPPPDQRSLLFVRGDHKGPESILWRVPVTGGPATKVGIAMNARIKSPAVHPNGKKLVFGAGEVDHNELWALENFLPAQAATR